MKRLVFVLSLLLLTGAVAPLFAVTRTVLVVDEVIRMSKAGVGDDEIIAYVKKTAEPYDISGDDVIAMTDAHVSKAVIKVVIDESSTRMKSERRETTTRVSVYAPYYDPWYSPYYYDPFWYGPRAYVGFGFGFSPRFGGGFRGGHRGGHRR